jgi:hypothetical protein
MEKMCSLLEECAYVFRCFSQQTPTVSLYNINGFVFVTEIVSV